MSRWFSALLSIVSVSLSVAAATAAPSTATTAATTTILDKVCVADATPAYVSSNTMAASNTAPFRHPVVAVSHGPGPLWLLDTGFGGMNKRSKSAQNLRTLFSKIYAPQQPLPKRILFVTAHWESESSGFEISKSAAPEMIYDYYGFPSESYEVVYSAKGDPDFAAHIHSVLAQNKIASKTVERGYDHGVFVPMFLIRPEADIPIVSVSINDRLSAKDHFELGQALAPLRDEDTLIICSGQATHNLRAGFDPSAPIADWAKAFEAWLDDTFTDTSRLSYSERQATVERWLAVPSAKQAHPTPDHFTPFVVAMGAGMERGAPAASKLFGGWGAGQLSFATYAWGIDGN